MRILEFFSNIFDLCHYYWEDSKNERRVSVALVWVFIAGIVGIELNRRGFLPPDLAKIAPTSHFQSVNLAFTLILALEVISLVFSLSCSLTRSMGKQLEILSLIFLRDAFKEVSGLGEPINVAANLDLVVSIGVYGLTSLLIFICIAVYSRVQVSGNSIKDPLDRFHYIMIKKSISLVMLGIFVYIACWGAYTKISTGVDSKFFESFYTTLIFADILLVLVGQIFMPSYYSIFRSSGYVVTTMLMRLAISAPVHYDVALGLFSAVFCIALTWATARFAPEQSSYAAKAKMDMTGREL